MFNEAAPAARFLENGHCCNAYFVTLTPEQIEFMLLQYATPWENERAYKKGIIDSFVSEIYLYDDRLLIYYNIRDDQPELTKSDLVGIENATAGGFDQRNVASTMRKKLVLMKIETSFFILNVNANIRRVILAPSVLHRGSDCQGLRRIICPLPFA